MGMVEAVLIALPAGHGPGCSIILYCCLPVWNTPAANVVPLGSIHFPGPAGLEATGIHFSPAAEVKREPEVPIPPEGVEVV